MRRLSIPSGCVPPGRRAAHRLGDSWPRRPRPLTTTTVEAAARTASWLVTGQDGLVPQRPVRLRRPTACRPTPRSRSAYRGAGPGRPDPQRPAALSRRLVHQRRVRGEVDVPFRLGRQGAGACGGRPRGSTSFGGDELGHSGSHHRVSWKRSDRRPDPGPARRRRRQRHRAGLRRASGSSSAGSSRRRTSLTNFLLKQQCSRGFRLDFATEEPEDAPVIPVGTRTTAPPRPMPPRSRCFSWPRSQGTNTADRRRSPRDRLADAPAADDGAFGGGARRRASNANSTGLAGWRSAPTAGRTLPRAGHWVRRLQVGSDGGGTAATPARTVRSRRQLPSYMAGERTASPTKTAGQWLRSTAQAVAVLSGRGRRESSACSSTG